MRSLSRRPAAQHVPTVFRNPQRWTGFELADVSRREALRRRAVHFFKFATEMRFISELQLVGGGLIGIALSDQVLGQAALQLPQPVAGRATQVLAKEPLQLTFGDRTKRSHFGGVEIGFPRHLLPLLNCQETAVHMKTL